MSIEEIVISAVPFPPLTTAIIFVLGYLILNLFYFPTGREEKNRLTWATLDVFDKAIFSFIIGFGFFIYFAVFIFLINSNLRFIINGSFTTDLSTTIEFSTFFMLVFLASLLTRFTSKKDGKKIIKYGLYFIYLLIGIATALTLFDMITILKLQMDWEVLVCSLMLIIIVGMSIYFYKYLTRIKFKLENNYVFVLTILVIVFLVILFSIVTPRESPILTEKTNGSIYFFTDNFDIANASAYMRHMDVYLMNTSKQDWFFITVDEKMSKERLVQIIVYRDNEYVGSKYLNLLGSENSTVIGEFNITHNTGTDAEWIKFDVYGKNANYYVFVRSFEKLANYTGNITPNFSYAANETNESLVYQFNLSISNLGNEDIVLAGNISRETSLAKNCIYIYQANCYLKSNITNNTVPCIQYEYDTSVYIDETSGKTITYTGELFIPKHGMFLYTLNAECMRWAKETT